MKKRIYLALWLAMMLTTLFFCMTAFATDGNLWYDGGFDNVTVNGSGQAQDDAYRNFTGDWRNPVKTAGDNKYLTIVGSGGGSPAISNITALNIDLSTNYIFSARLKNTTAGTAAQLKLLYNASSGTRTDLWNLSSLGTINASDEWTTYTIEIPAGTQIYYLYLRSTAGYLDIDDVSLVPENQGDSTTTISTALTLEKPVANAVPQTSITGTGYTANVTWSPEVSDKFAYGTAYTATITITTAPGYTTTGVTQNGYVIENATVTNAQDSNVVTAVFPATKEEPEVITTINSNLWTGTTAAEKFDFADTAALRSKYNNTWQTIITVDPQDADNKVVSLREWGWLYLTGADHNIEADRPIALNFKYYSTDGVAFRVFLSPNGTRSNATTYHIVAPSVTNQWVDYSNVLIGSQAYVHDGTTMYPGSTDLVDGITISRYGNSTTTNNFLIDDVTLVPYFKATYYMNDGTNTTAATKYFLESSYVPGTDVTAPVREGHTFLGWSTTSTGEVVNTVNTTPGEDINLYAIWFNENPEVIDTNIELEAPFANMAPQTTVEGTGYTGNVTWSPLADEKFDYNTVYTATITLTTTNDYTTTGVPENGYTVAGASSVVNDENSNIITVTFPATAAKVTSNITAFEPYTLSYNSNHSDTGNYRKGPHAGWSYDNRGGRLMTTLNKDYNVIDDISTDHASSLYKDLNKTDEGFVVLETAFKITQGLNGFSLCFTDEDGNNVYSLNTVSGSFKTLKADGSYRTLCDIPSNYKTENIHVLVKLDFENMLAYTVIDGVYYGTDALLSDNIMRFAYKTTKENAVSVTLSNSTKITANYYITDDFNYYTEESETIPYGWVSTDPWSAFVSATEGYVSGGESLTKTLDSDVRGKVSFEGIFFAPSGVSGSFEIFSGVNEVIDLTFDGNDLTSRSNLISSDYLTDFWHKFRIELDLDNHTADVKINGRKVKTVLLPLDAESIDTIKITGDSTLAVKFDDLKLFSLVEHDDYVPVPVLPDEDEYYVGINVCPLWSYESAHTWANISPYEEFRPVLGYYDDGNPEVADWEIKMMAEHGVDFQAFCWYADNSNGPLKHQRHGLALHEGYMNAKYSDMMKYAIIWEARSGDVPESMQAVYDYFVPYWIENYFKDDRYMTVDGKLIMYIYDYGTYIHHGICESDFTKTKSLFTTIKSMVKQATGKDLIIISVSPSPGDSVYIEAAGLDGVSAYHWGTDGYSWEHNKAGIIAAAENSENANKTGGYTWTIPTLSTGFNHLPWDEGDRHPNMTVSDFTTGLTWIRDTYFETYPPKYGWQENLIMLSNWNEYGEGTYIMPSGLNGFGYLEAVREVLTDGSNENTHTDYALTDAQLERLGKNYPQYVKLLRRTYSETIDTSVTVDTELYIDSLLINSSLNAEETQSGAIYFPFDTYWYNTSKSAYASITNIMKLHHEWDYDNGILTLYGNDDTYAVFTVGSDTVNYNGGTITLPDPIYMRDGIPMIHMETVCNIFGFEYEYSGNNLYITTPAEEKANINLWTGNSKVFTFDDLSGLTLTSQSASPTDPTDKTVKLGNWNSVGLSSANWGIEADRPVELSFKYYAVSGTLSVRLNQVIDSELGNVVAYFTTTKNAWTNYSKTIIPKDSYTHNGSLAWAGGENAVLNNIFLRIWGSGEIYIDDLAVVPYYKVTYDANGGEGAPEHEYFLARTYTVNDTAIPTREGYEFVGWATSEQATADDVVLEVTPTYGEDITLYAVWQAE